MAWKFKLLTRVSNLFRQQADRSQLSHQKYIPYFDFEGNHYDNFPLEWAKIIQESPSGSSCLSTTQDFLKGYGFSDEELEKKIVNSQDETFFQLHQQSADSFAQFEGFYWLTIWNRAQRITEIRLLPFENCRLGKPDDKGWIQHIYYNPFFATKYYKSSDKKQTTVYDVFNPDAVPAQQKRDGDKYKGQVLFVGTTNALSRFYPIHSAYSCKKSMQIESGISDYHEDNINNGLLQPYILVMRGNPDAPSTNPDYQSTNGDRPATVAQEFDMEIAENFMGAKRVGNVWVQWVNQSDEKPEVVPLPTNANGDLFITLDNQVTKKITIAWKVPAVLANIHEGVSLGGDGNQIRVAVKLMQQRSKDKQRILTDTYEKILPLMQEPYTEPVAITPYNPYPELEVLDDKIWESMTAEERRKWINENTEIALTEPEDTTTTEPSQPAAPNPATTARVSNAIPVGFPESVRNQVKKALDYRDKMGILCGGKGGIEVAKAILDNQSMGLKQLKRIYSYLKKNEKFESAPFNEGCDVILYNQWGGKEMKNFLESKLKEIDNWIN
jgi:hypothetical protein